MSLIEGYWLPVKDGDPRAKGIQTRHYSSRHYRDGRRPLKIMGPGEYVLLMTADCRAIFGWHLAKVPRMDEQEGVSCTIFRNETETRSSLMILEAEIIARDRWPEERRLYTYVNPAAIRSTNPGYCFLVAEWRKCGVSPSGLVILEKLVRAQE